MAEEQTSKQEIQIKYVRSPKSSGCVYVTQTLWARPNTEWEITECFYFFKL